MRQNPFIVGQPVPPELFIGRTSLVATAFDQIHSRSHLAVWGGSGTGKSSFLELFTSAQIWQLHGLDPSPAVIVLLNCLAILPFSGAGFWRKVLKSIENKLDSIPDLQADIDRLLAKEKNTADDLLEVLRKLGNQNKYLVLLVDDYDAALRPNYQYGQADIEAFLSQCRTIAYSATERKYLSTIVTSSRMLSELGPKLTPEKSPWYNHYLFRSLKPLTDREVDDLLTGMPITPALKEEIREIADGNPALQQNAGYLLYEELRASRIPEPVIFAKEFQNATLQFFQATWELSTEIEQTLLMLLALSKLEGRLAKKRYDLSGIENIFSQKEIELNALVGRGVIKHTGKEEETTYAFASSIMEWWTIKKIENSNEEELQQRQKLLFNLMSRKQAEKVTTAIHWLWQHKDEVPPILKWIGKIAAV